jgi:glyoxalase family protein
VAFASELDEHGGWRARVMEAGGRPTPVIDRFYFRSIYFREPAGVLFEIASKGPGFAADEDPDRLGERLSLPPDYEHLRERLEQVLTPLPDPRSRAAAG